MECCSTPHEKHGPSSGVDTSLNDRGHRQGQMKASGKAQDGVAMRELDNIRYLARERSIEAEEAQKILEIEEARLMRLRNTVGAKPREIKDQQDRVEGAWRIVTEREEIRDLALLEVHRLEEVCRASKGRIQLEKEMDVMRATWRLQDETRRAQRVVERERAKLEATEAKQASQRDLELKRGAQAREAQLAARKRLFATQQILRQRKAEDDAMREEMAARAQTRVLKLRDALLGSKERIEQQNAKRNAKELDRLVKFEAEKKDLLEQGLNPYEVFRNRQLEEMKAAGRRRAVELRKMRDEALKNKMQYEAKLKAKEVARKAESLARAAEFQRNVSGVADRERFGEFIAKHSIGGVPVLDPTGTAVRIDGSKVTVCRDMSFGLGRASEEVINKAKREVAAMERSVRKVLRGCVPDHI